MPRSIKPPDQIKIKKNDLGSIVNGFMSATKTIQNPLSGQEEELTIKEMIVLRTLKNALDSGDLNTVKYLFSISDPNVGQPEPEAKTTIKIGFGEKLENGDTDSGFTI